jgi:hypothetical protein
MLASPDWTNEVLDEGRTAMSRLGAAVDEADPAGLVLPRSRLLCAGLARLAVEVARSLGAGERAREVADVAASISILTKLDDEVIDARAFHGGAATDRLTLARKTAAFLAPTLASMREGSPATTEPRCVLAATIGARIRGLAGSPSRGEALLDLLARGWTTQVEAVVTLTNDPAAVDLRTIDRVTRRISGDWLAIVAACGALPREARRWLAADEIEAIRDLGLYIQRSDSLCDLEKDQAEGLTSTWAACRAARVGRPVPPRSLEALFEVLHRAGIDAAAIPSRAETEALATRLRELGGVHGLLEWIRKMLLARYLAHPLARAGTREIVRTKAGAPCSAR